MLNLYTGAPGAGKTLKMLADHLATADGNRPIFVYGVEGLVPSDKWTPLDDPKEWHKCPYGSLVLVDEAQAVFRPRRPGDPIPEYVSAAETHRHLGIDLIMTTQYPMLIDAHLRRLVSNHQHLVNVWGLKGRSSVYEWSEAQDDPKDPRARKLARRFLFKYPKQVYDLYKSAQIHTKKPRIPLWFKFGIPVIALIFCAAAYYGYYAISHFASNGAKPMNQFLAAHPTGHPSSVVNAPFALTHGAAATLASHSHTVLLKHPAHPLQDFNAYSLPVRSEQAAELPRISGQFRVAGSIGTPGMRRVYVIQSRSGVEHIVQGIRCSNLEGLEVCRWGGGYVSSAPLPDRTSSRHHTRFVNASTSRPAPAAAPGASPVVPVPAAPPPGTPPHHHSVLLPVHSVVGAIP